MALLNANAYYRENQVTTASRGQLLLMAYDGMLRFLADGRRAMAEQRYEAQGACIGRTQDILLELICGLDHTVLPDLSARLDSLYRYMFDRLTTANVKNDEQALMEVATMLSDLRETWAEADRMTRCQANASQSSLVGGCVA